MALDEMVASKKASYQKIWQDNHKTSCNHFKVRVDNFAISLFKKKRITNPG